ncbi:UvsX-like recombinase [Staphylococcus phage vB_StaM_PB50]|nr:UvsX-like recombinase [Staphylococcus phage vB_StaM_PB50]
MAKLTSKIHDLIKSNPNVYGKEDNYTPMYESGINLLDYRNGFLNTVTDDERIGLMGGKVTTFIGGSGSGKTTLAIQAAAKIVEPFENASIIHYDFEDATTDERIYQLTGWSKQTKQDKYTKLNKKISLDSVDQLIRGIRDTKLESEEEFTIHTDKIDPETGEKVSFMAPTVVIIDSVATMASKEIDDKDGEGGQMNATKQAKDNTTFIKRIIGSSTLNSANIMLILINHITTKIDINPYAATPKELNYLKQGEALPGGKAINYMANNMFKISPSQALDPEGSSNQAKYGIKGFINTVEVIKSRSNAAGAKFNLIFEQKDGFNNTLSNLLYLQEQKLLKGNPRAYRIDGYDDVSFTLKTFQEKYEGNKDFQEYFDKYIRNIYKDKFLASIEHESSLDEEELELVECINSEEDIWLGSDGKYYDSEKNEVEVEKG